MRGWKTLLPVAMLIAMICSTGMSVMAEDKPGLARVGEISVYILTDGHFEMDGKVFLTPKPDQEAALRKIYPQGKTRNALNTFLIKKDGKVILIDTGGGALMGTMAGGLPKALTSIGLSPADITDIIITHAHRDHIGGLGLGGKAVFPNAKVHISKIEHDFWLNPANESKVSERARPTFATAREMFALYPGKIVTYDPDKEFVPGVRILPAYGHTPGHIVVLVSSKNENLLIWSDLLHGLELQVARPDVAVIFDSDPAKAVETRKAFLARAAKEGWMVAGCHTPESKAYRIKAEGEGFALVNK